MTSKAVKDVQALGFEFWANGPVTGTYWAHSADGVLTLLDTAGNAIDADNGTPAQRKAFIRSGELTEAFRAEGAVVSYASFGSKAVKVPLPAHIHIRPKRWDGVITGPDYPINAGECFHTVPFSFKADTKIEHVGNFGR